MRGVEKIVARERKLGNPVRSYTSQFTNNSIEQNLVALVAAPRQELSELEFMQLSVAGSDLFRPTLHQIKVTLTNSYNVTLK